ncbi:fungal hydrophobin-domain-containing protein [Earliella scabrosa]|nr:fungal hydrophobin-domain-containing protein [Earliella scabrosa]
MMFSRVAVFTAAALPLLAAATPLAARGGEPSCSTGPIQCCNSVSSVKDNSALGGLLGLLGVVVQDVTAAIGLGCSPISVIGVGGGSCNANAVCCQNNNVGGLISIGCVPVII